MDLSRSETRVFCALVLFLLMLGAVCVFVFFGCSATDTQNADSRIESLSSNGKPAGTDVFNGRSRWWLPAR